MRAAPPPPSLTLLTLETPPVPCEVPAGVFDAFGWCLSDTLRAFAPQDAAGADALAIDGDNPAGMVFVFHAPCTFLPKEQARWHAPGLGLDDHQVLAPYAIDDATDELYATGSRPRDLLWLVAPGLARLFWGLHDWAHFHNHGPFDERAFTELQCDGTALAWLARNRAALALDEARLTQVREQVIRLASQRFVDEPSALAPMTKAEVARTIDALTAACAHS